MKIIQAISALVLLLAVSACGGSDKFRIEGHVEGNPTINLYVKYLQGDHLVSGVTAVKDGDFVFDARSATPTLVEIYDNDNRILGRVYAQNGDKISLTLTRPKLYQMKATGDEFNEQWSATLNALGDSLDGATPEQTNRVLEGYFAKNDNALINALLFATTYYGNLDPLRADSVLNSLNLSEPGTLAILSPYLTAANHYAQEGSYGRIDTLIYRIVERDTVALFIPRKYSHGSLLVLSNDRQIRNDSIVPRLKKLKKDKSKLEVLDLMLCSDTGTWKRNIRKDSADWAQGWMPGGIFAKGIDTLAIPEIPYYIAIDSGGRQIYRGNSLESAINAHK